ncbi:VanZ family protein [Shewanella indica]|uniref:VanZ family protein n=1 Tax=Shewanella indica TaxID=768528 RepID=UPI0030079D64
MINRQLLFKIALLIALAVISYLVFSKPNYPQSIPNLDKVGHIGSFFALAWLTYLAFRPRWYLMFATLAGYGFLIEMVQSRLPYRSADMADFVADMTGVVLFYVSLWGYRKYFGAAMLKE